METKIQDRIYRIRGQQVMLDRDLAILYGVETRTLNQAVKRHQERFPVDFMFTLTRHEIVNISQSVICSESLQLIKHSKRVAVFTEHGVSMLSGILTSPKAIQINIAIIRAFIKLRHAVLVSRDIARRVEKLEGTVQVHNTDIRLLNSDVSQLKKEGKTSNLPEPTKRIRGFKGSNE